MSSLPKIAAVVLTASAVIFMGVGAGMLFGRPDPVAEMVRSKEIAEYNFQPTEGGGWTIVGLDGNSQSKDNAYRAVLAAYESKETMLKNETSEMTASIEVLQKEIAERKASQSVDVAALQARREYIAQLVDNQVKQLLQDSQTLQALSVDTLAVRQETADRREDVTRLQSELEELRTDRYRLAGIQRALTDRLLRLHLENEALQRRLDQMTAP